MSGKRKQTDLSHYFGSQQPANERNEVEHPDVDDDNESPPGGGNSEPEPSPKRAKSTETDHEEGELVETPVDPAQTRVEDQMQENADAEVVDLTSQQQSTDATTTAGSSSKPLFCPVFAFNGETKEYVLEKKPPGSILAVPDKYNDDFVNIGGRIWCKRCIVFNPKSTNYASQDGKKLESRHISDAFTKHITSASHKKATDIMNQRHYFRISRAAAVEKSVKDIDPQLRTAYFIGKHDLAMDKSRYLNALQRANGVPYQSTKHVEDCACKDFVGRIDEALQEDMKTELAKAEFISVLVDETTDTTKYKVALTFVFYVMKGMVTEAMLALTDLEGQGTAEAVYAAVKKVLIDDFQVDPEKLACTGTDGAAAMLADNGFCGLMLKRLNPHILKFHCAAHRLQLAVQDALAVKLDSDTRNETMDFIDCYESTLKLIYKHFKHSSARLTSFQKLAETLGEKYLSFKKLYNVRWLSRDGATKAAFTNLPALLSYTAELLQGQPNDVNFQVLHRSVRDVRFLFGLHLFSKIHSSLALDSKKLQKNIVGASVVVNTVETAVSMLTNVYMPQGVASPWLIFPAVVEFKKRTVGLAMTEEMKYDDHQVYFPPTGTFSPEGCTADASFYRKIYDEIVQPMISDLKSSLERRFPDGGLVKAFSIFDLKELKRRVLNDNGVNDLFTEEIEVLKKHYTMIRQKEKVNGDGSTTMVDAAPLFEVEVDLIEEWTRFKYFLRNVDPQRLTSWDQFYDRGYAEQFCNVFKLISISLILPLSTAIVERGFSVMNAGIKNKLRNRLQPETVDMLMRISINGPDMFVEEKGELELSCKAAFVMTRAKELWLGAKPQGRRF